MLARLIILSSVLALSACGSAGDSGEATPSEGEQQTADIAPINENTDATQAENQETTIEGVQTTNTGLQYEVLRAADGDSPGPSSVVTVHYLGTLTDGTQFDSSYDRGSPSTFSLRSVITGWTEGVQLMNVGSKYRFTIPPELGYGESQVGDIPPNSTLIFEVELLEINS